MPIVNPDVLPGAPVEQGIAAVKQREALLKAQQSFAVETTATGNVFLKKVQDIKIRGSGSTSSISGWIAPKLPL